MSPVDFAHQRPAAAVENQPFEPNVVGAGGGEEAHAARENDPRRAARSDEARARSQLNGADVETAGRKLDRRPAFGGAVDGSLQGGSLIALGAGCEAGLGGG